MSDESTYRQRLCEIGRRIHARGFVAANDGNLSVRLSRGAILATPTGISKGLMSPEAMVLVDLQGRLLSGGKPSSELPMHLFIYRERPEVNAVVHAHPVYATGFATAGLSLESCVAAEIIATLGSVPLASYGTPSTAELPESLRPFIHRSDAILLANHGVVTVGRELEEAYDRLERVEHYAHILFVARQLGGERLLSREQVEKLFALRGKYGQTGLNPGCATCAGDCLESLCPNYAEKFDPGGRDHLGMLVDRILTRLRD
ncbi:MAG: class II aldolase/adducin family protein [candidate division KSB1 bacterium]|nr:class II aldolase/adducin family protein [candidate division KSB1 bacterium]MDZ7274842.1 class II aldolase/adducin family protein [candidate division KSB1 bacterium]MDZ7288209.1 class II aldolase/adducin family protein [candidate division KSB1 bacterium]MDZ7300410.1 class II aldolase/adducin family protein [candidate division KSB1 bacterium]MDZ7308135.1 class II aldolase/adducin family protein [candidate division KSB1 bacterium]